MKSFKKVKNAAAIINCLVAISTISSLGFNNISQAAGPSDGGGGDGSEIRFDEIRSDILKWIRTGGADDLKLPKSLDVKEYKTAMSKLLTPQNVIISFVTTTQEKNTHNPELKVVVDGRAKTCRGFFSKKDRQPHILCNKERFDTETQATQYKLVHHEFAGLAGIEKNIGASSDYEISNQITDYLVPETIYRLAIKDPAKAKAKESLMEFLKGKDTVEVKSPAYTPKPSIKIPVSALKTQKPYSCNRANGWGDHNCLIEVKLESQCDTKLGWETAYVSFYHDIRTGEKSLMSVTPAECKVVAALIKQKKERHEAGNYYPEEIEEQTQSTE